jgi:hypothetical protein
MKQLEMELANIIATENLYSIAIARKLCDKFLEENDALELLKIDLELLKRLKNNK